MDIGPVHALDFTPRLYDAEGELEINFSFTRDENRTDESGFMRQDVFLKEKINLILRGYVYHPRFITIYLKTSAGLKHEDFRTENRKASWWTSSSFEYEWRNFILPEHPYNLELFFIRKEPLSRQGLMRISPAVITIEGGKFKYEKKPYFLNMLYSQVSTHQEDIRYDTRLFSNSMRYFKEFKGGRSLSFTGSFLKSESPGSDSRELYQLGNGINLGFFNLNSSLSFDHSTHRDLLKQDIDSFNWSERLLLRLPFNFSSGLSFSYTKDESTADKRIKREREVNSGLFSLSHQLFASLSTTYRFNYLSSMSFEDNLLRTIQSEIKTTSHFFSTNYTKSIRGGRFTAGFNLGTSLHDRKGEMSIIKEPHSAQPGIIGNDEFDLNERNVLIQSIEVYVENPDNRMLYLLTPVIHYEVIEIGDITRIRILDLPPGAWSTDPSITTYQFFVSYRTEARDVELKTDTHGYNLRLDLFNNLLSPYYSHNSLKTYLRSGFYEGRLPDTEIDTVGLIISRKPYNIFLQYQNVDSNINPSESFRAEFRYGIDLNPNFNILSKIFYSETWYQKGYMTRRDYKETTKGAAIDIRRKFYRNLWLNGGAKYTRRDSLSDADAYLLSSSLSFRSGMLELTGGLNLQWSRTHSDNMDTRRFSELFYINIKRKLF
ncbi:MAG: hypothetical protein N2257_02020 [Thermodesulfovibrionales bacterium]|nr:hypothetical protein [Thermodesulfovibrionales bacterium]